MNKVFSMIIDINIFIRYYSTSCIFHVIRDRSQAPGIKLREWTCTNVSHSRNIFVGRKQHAFLNIDDTQRGKRGSVKIN